MKKIERQNLIKCNEVRKKLIFLAEGRLEKEQEVMLQHHLETCIECTTHYQKIKTALSELDKEKIREFNPYFSMKVMERLKNKAEPERALIPYFTGILKPVMVVLLLAVAIFTGIILGGRYSQLNKTAVNGYRATELQAITDDYYLDDLSMENIESILITDNSK